MSWLQYIQEGFRVCFNTNFHNDNFIPFDLDPFSLSLSLLRTPHSSIVHVWPAVVVWPSENVRISTITSQLLYECSVEWQKRDISNFGENNNFFRLVMLCVHAKILFVLRLTQSTLSLSPWSREIFLDRKTKTVFIVSRRGRMTTQKERRESDIQSLEEIIFYWIVHLYYGQRILSLLFTFSRTLTHSSCRPHENVNWICSRP